MSLFCKTRTLPPATKQLLKATCEWSRWTPSLWPVLLRLLHHRQEAQSRSPAHLCRTPSLGNPGFPLPNFLSPNMVPKWGQPTGSTHPSMLCGPGRRGLADGRDHEPLLCERPAAHAGWAPGRGLGSSSTACWGGYLSWLGCEAQKGWREGSSPVRLKSGRPLAAQ